MKRRSHMAPQRYAPSAKEPLAVDPQAFFELFIVPSSRESELIGDTCVVDVCGPLEQYDAGWCDSYESVKARVVEACASAAKAIVMRIDSPGGTVSGCFDAVRAIRAACVAAGKPLYAYCDHACSAGYALASAATHGIVMSDTGTVGSIGCVQTRPDFSAANAARGVRFEFIASGARKIDGNVDAAITDDEIKATRERVDYVAGLFFSLIEETRGIGAARVAALQAGVFHGDGASRERLVDGVMPFETLLARIASGEALIMSAYEKARAALEEAAKGDDANAASAKKALAAMAIGGDDDDGDDGDKEADAEGDDKEADAGGDDKDADAQSDADDDGKPPKKDAPAATTPPAAAADATTHSIALQALAKSHELEARLQTRDDRDERKRLLATRPDFDQELRTELMKKSTPLATVKNMVKTLKRKKVANAAAAASATGIRGEGQGESSTGGSEPNAANTDEVLERKSRMGLTTSRLGVVRENAGGVTTAIKFGVIEEPYKAAASGGAGGGK